MGFCLFNIVAVGAAYLKHRYGVKRILIVDIDIHHGNCMQKAFYDTQEVLYFSAHQFPCYPGTGKLADLPTLSPEKIHRMTPEKPDRLPELKKAMDFHRTFWPAIP